jgi:asparagine synthase (glutamine-hydrolysing)
MCGIWGLLSLKPIQNYSMDTLFNKFNTIKYRGPDKSTFISTSNYIVGFHRLAIMDLSIQGDQPFSHSYYFTNDLGEKILRTVYVISNGEIYNFKDLKALPEVSEALSKYNYQFKSESDCEVLLPLFLSNGLNCADKDKGLSEMISKLSGEFAFAIYDIEFNTQTNKYKYNLWTGRDRFGIRPLFYTKLNDWTICFGSEAKSLVELSQDDNKSNVVEVHDPRTWMHWSGGQDDEFFVMTSKLYYSVGKFPVVINPEPADVYRMIRTKLTQAVKSRLESDREIGCLLSGGLDSSLISAIAAKELGSRGKKLRTFSIGMKDSPDVIFAQIVATHIGSTHTNIEIPENKWVETIEQVVKINETFDITTTRATVGQYLVSKWIRDNTDIKVLLIGDGSDEATGGYLYFHKAPNRHEFHFECIRLLHYIHYFDVLRADRGIASNGLEARVPFLDHEFINFYFQIDLIMKTPQSHTLADGSTQIFEKYLLRKAWDSTDLLPKSVLWRRKEAFSDGVSSGSRSWYQIIQEKVETKYSDEDLEQAKKYYESVGSVIPHTKEALYYHQLFDKYYPSQHHLCPYYWLPKWVPNALDPSARTLNVYKELESSK